MAVGVLSAFSAMATGLPDGGNNWTLVWADEFDRDGEPDQIGRASCRERVY